jgi:Ca2+-binding EF-hand superfamily protein
VIVSQLVSLSYILYDYVVLLDSGTVDFREFICMMSTFCKVKTPLELDQELREIFQVIFLKRNVF